MCTLIIHFLLLNPQATAPVLKAGDLCPAFVCVYMYVCVCVCVCLVVCLFGWRVCVWWVGGGRGGGGGGVDCTDSMYVV